MACTIGEHDLKLVYTCFLIELTIIPEIFRLSVFIIGIGDKILNGLPIF